MGRSKVRVKKRASGSAAPAGDKVVMGVPELLKAGEEAVDELDYEQAVQYFGQALALDTQNHTILDKLGEALLENGQPVEAHAAFARSVHLAPGEGYSKYMYLAQLSEGRDSLQSINIGIQVLQNDLAKYQAAGDAEHLKMTKVHLTQAYCSVCELYMTDLCDEPSAEAECERALELAAATDPDIPEAYQALANLRIVQCRKEEALKCSRKALQLHKDLMDAESPLVSSVDYRLDCAKLLIELEDYDSACDLLELLVMEDDSLDILLLMGQACRLAGDPEAAVDYLTRAEQAVAVMKATGQVEEGMEKSEKEVNEFLALARKEVAALPAATGDIAEEDEDDMET